ncbi:MAG: hypothetical protein EHM14_04450 [Methanothrix sp.]|nr:MAG: hypothetical protein EHM14_04450 [Methanothrix sp.]
MRTCWAPGCASGSTPVGPGRPGACVARRARVQARVHAAKLARRSWVCFVPSIVIHEDKLSRPVPPAVENNDCVKRKR